TGQLGDGTDTDRSSPVAVSGLSSAVDVSVGGFLRAGPFGLEITPSHSCASLVGGTVRCWGDNSVGQLGRSGGSSKAPVAVTGVSDAASLASGSGLTCTRRAGGTVSCWGANGFDEIQAGGLTGSPV